VLQVLPLPASIVSPFGRAAIREDTEQPDEGADQELPPETSRVSGTPVRILAMSGQDHTG
jgi:hypothetical protein